VIEIFNFYQYLQSSHRFRHSVAYSSIRQELKSLQLQARQIRSKKRKREDDDEGPETKRQKNDSLARMQRLLDLYNTPSLATEDKENDPNLRNLFRDSNQNPGLSSHVDIICDDIIEVDEPTPKESFQASNLRREISVLQEKLKFKYTDPSITYHTYELVYIKLVFDKLIFIRKYKASSVRWSPANQDFMFVGFLNYNRIFM